MWVTLNCIIEERKKGGSVTIMSNCVVSTYVQNPYVQNPSFQNPSFKNPLMDYSVTWSLLTDAIP